MNMEFQDIFACDSVRCWEVEDECTRIEQCRRRRRGMGTVDPAKSCMARFWKGCGGAKAFIYLAQIKPWLKVGKWCVYLSTCWARYTNDRYCCPPCRRGECIYGRFFDEEITGLIGPVCWRAQGQPWTMEDAIGGPRNMCPSECSAGMQGRKKRRVENQLTTSIERRDAHSHPGCCELLHVDNRTDGGSLFLHRWSERQDPPKSWRLQKVAQKIIGRRQAQHNIHIT